VAAAPSISSAFYQIILVVAVQLSSTSNGGRHLSVAPSVGSNVYHVSTQHASNVECRHVQPVTAPAQRHQSFDDRYAAAIGGGIHPKFLVSQRPSAAGNL